MRAWLQLLAQAGPGLEESRIPRQVLHRGLDARKFDLDAIEHEHPLRHALREPTDIGEQQAALDRKIAAERLDRCDSIVQRRLRILERKAVPARHHGPFADLDRK